MAITLSKEALENIKNYKYETNDWTYMDNQFNPFWEFCVRNLSKVSHHFSVLFYFRKLLPTFSPVLESFFLL